MEGARAEQIVVMVLEDLARDGRHLAVQSIDHEGIGGGEQIDFIADRVDDISPFRVGAAVQTIHVTERTLGDVRVAFENQNFVLQRIAKHQAQLKRHVEAGNRQLSWRAIPFEVGKIVDAEDASPNLFGEAKEAQLTGLQGDDLGSESVGHATRHNFNQGRVIGGMKGKIDEDDIRG